MTTYSFYDLSFSSETYLLSVATKAERMHMNMHELTIFAVVDQCSCSIRLCDTSPAMTAHNMQMP
jgi:hypothetical protein